MPNAQSLSAHRSARYRTDLLQCIAPAQRAIAPHQPHRSDTRSNPTPSP
ncbi:MAG: hypothetical protein AAF329_00670 [Cyanobacteria bacterium P01_A01_bin.17]